MQLGNEERSAKIWSAFGKLARAPAAELTRPLDQCPSPFANNGVIVSDQDLELVTHKCQGQFHLDFVLSISGRGYSGIRYTP